VKQIFINVHVYVGLLNQKKGQSITLVS